MRKATLLLSDPVFVVTSTSPVVAPVGTVVMIAEPDEFTVNDPTAVPLKVTFVAFFKLFPRMVTFPPTLPEMGFVSTNGPSPTDRL